MKKIVAFLAIALFLVSIPLAAQADKADFFRALAAKVQAAVQGRSLAQADPVGHYGVYYSYTVKGEGWWTGLVVANQSDLDSQFQVGVMDTDGAVVASGTFTLAGYASKADFLENFTTAPDKVPFRGQLVVFGSQSFFANLYVGNDQGGFGEIEKEAEPY